jgi:Z1 domain
MIDPKVLARLASAAGTTHQYEKQLNRVRAQGDETEMIEEAVDKVMSNLPKAATGSLVVYGDPQSGKTEMMICLTARLLDDGHKTIVHLMNDSVDLLMQSLDRFKLAGLAPAPRSATDLANSPLVRGHNAILFCKKNAKDLDKMIAALAGAGPIVVIDDEADYATPNAKINQNKQTAINKLVTTLVGRNGIYIGVTATPARLNLNNTFDNRTETWVRFRPHGAYTGQDAFFPLIGTVPYRLDLLSGPGTGGDARDALARFLVTVAYLNTTGTAAGKPEANYSFLVHTSGKTLDHKTDRKTIEAAMAALIHGSGSAFKAFVGLIFAEAKRLYPSANAEKLTAYVVANASRSAFVVLNSKRDRAIAGDQPTKPTCPFTVIIGGNIVSRGVTFPNLLSMFFTRNVQTKLQQDTYIQRARMFGARGKYLPHFELTIPKQLYADWHRCFVFHRLALEAIENNRMSPVWVGDKRISIAASSSIDRATVDLSKGEMSFQIFACPDLAKLDGIVAADQTNIETLTKLARSVKPGLPLFLIEYLRSALALSPGTLAIHTSSSIANYGKTADIDAISRTKGFLGKPQLETTRFPKGIHHVKILHNGKGKGRVFYKNLGGVDFVQNLKSN